MAPENVTTQTQKSSKRRNKKSTTDAKVNPPAALDSATANLSIEEEDTKAETMETGFDNPHIKELQKNLRNATKRLTGMSKVEAILEDNPSVPVDDLVAQRKINQDQKAQILKKPALQAQIKELENQIAMHKQIEEDFSRRLQAQKEYLDNLHQKELEEVKAAAATPQPEPQDEAKPDLRPSLLILSKFLRAAAARRQDSDETSEESKGFEGVLLLLYGGDGAAVDAAENLILGSSDLIPSTEGGNTSVSYGRVSQLAVEDAPFAEEEAWVNGVADASADPAAEQATFDPTITNAGLTELAATPVAPAHATEPANINVNSVSTIDAGAANSAGLPQSTTPLAESWVSVPRAPEETEVHNTATSAAVPSNQTENWTEPVTASTADSWQQAGPVNDSVQWTEQSAAPATESWADSPMEGVLGGGASPDGFHEVHHGRAPRGGRGGGGFEGRRGPRGGFRGGDRGRGDFRGRGRGFEGRGGGGRGRGRPGREAGAPGF